MTLTPLDETKIIQNVKLDLEITDKLQDGLLKMLLDRVVKHFKAEYGVSDIDDAYSFIFEDCVIKRFNRRGSEGEMCIRDSNLIQLTICRTYQTLFWLS